MFSVFYKNQLHNECDFMNQIRNSMIEKIVIKSTFRLEFYSIANVRSGSFEVP